MNRKQVVLLSLLSYLLESTNGFNRGFHLIRPFPRAIQPTFRVLKSVRENNQLDFDEIANAPSPFNDDDDDDDDNEGEWFDPFDTESEEIQELDAIHALLKKHIKFNETAYLDALIKNDVYRTDNYWETVFPKYQEKKKRAILKGDYKRVNELEDNFNELMQLGFERRLLYEDTEFDFDDPEIAHKNTYGITHAVVNSLLHVSKTPQQLIEEFQKKRAEKRVGWAKRLPPKLLVFYDFLVSVYTPPSSGDMLKSMTIGVIASMFTFVSNGWSYGGTILFGLAFLALQTALRNAPPPDPIKRTSMDISSFSMKASMAICLSMFSLFFGLSVIPLWFFPIGSMAILEKINLAVVVGLTATAYFSAFFEVYEPKSKAGSRWKAAISGYSESELEEFMAKQQQREESPIPDFEEYSFEYDPENEAMVKQMEAYEKEQDKEANVVKSQMEIDADKEEKQWLKERKERNKAWKEDITEADLPWLGVKEGFFDKAAKLEQFDPEMEEAYFDVMDEKVLWREEEQVINYKPIMGTWGYREANPAWFKKLFMQENGEDAINEMKLDYGFYRKGMYKLDPEVELQQCDGVGRDDDEEGGGKDKKKDDDEEEDDEEKEGGGGPEDDDDDDGNGSGGGGGGGNGDGNGDGEGGGGEEVALDEHEKLMQEFFGNGDIIENVGEEDLILFEELSAMEAEEAYEDAEQEEDNEDDDEDDDNEKDDPFGDDEPIEEEDESGDNDD